jgi:hypothetical protein
MRIIETKVYTINEHPNKDLCFDWIRNHWHDLNDHSVQEVKDSIEALSEAIGGTNDYSFGAEPMRGEFVAFSDYDKDMLMKLNPNALPLTGTWADYIIIIGLQNNEPSSALIDLHDDTEYLYSDAGLEEMCEAMEWEFTEQGKAL